jgi:hypothetical protein
MFFKLKTLLFLLFSSAKWQAHVGRGLRPFDNSQINLSDLACRDFRLAAPDRPLLYTALPLISMFQWANAP